MNLIINYNINHDFREMKLLVRAKLSVVRLFGKNATRAEREFKYQFPKIVKYGYFILNFLQGFFFHFSPVDQSTMNLILCQKKTVLMVFFKKNIPKFSSVFFWWVHQNYTSKSDFSISKTKNAHNSLHNGVRAVLTAFLDFQFFKAPLNLW